MATKDANRTSCNRQIPNSHVKFEVHNQLVEIQCLENVRKWIQTEAEFYGRTDDEFLLMFIRGCKFDEEMAKQALNRYYRQRKHFPRWWAQRDLKDLRIISLLHLKTTTALIDEDPTQPSIMITTSARVGDNLNNFDDYIKLHGIYVEVIMRRRSSQSNGIIWIINNKNYKYWAATKLLSPSFFMNINNGIIPEIPIAAKNLIFLNNSLVVRALNKLIQPFVTERFHFYGSDWSALGDLVPMERLPDEYGGRAGPMEQHDDAFIKEVLSYTDYLADDNQYGFQ